MANFNFWTSVSSKDADAETVQNVKRAIDQVGLAEFDSIVTAIFNRLAKNPRDLRESEQWMILALTKYAYTSIRNRLLEDGDVTANNANN